MARENDGYTAGEFARIAGITPRMLRHYDKIGLLKPQSRTAGGYRIYGEESLIRLQKIMMLRYLDFSLDQIANILYQENDQEISESLQRQQLLLQAQRRHIDALLEALQAAQDKAAQGQIWDALSQVMRLSQHRQRVLERYENTPLRRPASQIHSRYSQNPYGWHNWIFDRLALRPGNRIAICYALWDDIWLQNADRIPSGTQIEMFDCVQWNLEASRQRLGACTFPPGVSFRYTLWPSSEARLAPERYDLVVANQLFIHANDLTDYFLMLHGALKPGGRFCCLALGRDHMKELMTLTQAFEPKFLNYNSEFNSRFSLDNGVQQIQKIFGNAARWRYDDSLLVTDAESICDYLYGGYTNASDVLKDRRGALYDYYAAMLKHGPLHVTKAQGIIEAVKVAQV